jgi:hypothetical protein
VTSTSIVASVDLAEVLTHQDLIRLVSRQQRGSAPIRGRDTPPGRIIKLPLTPASPTELRAWAVAVAPSTPTSTAITSSIVGIGWLAEWKQLAEWEQPSGHALDDVNAGI